MFLRGISWNGDRLEWFRLLPMSSSFNFLERSLAAFSNRRQVLHSAGSLPR
ncbi:hypothetical protein Droror1_Dr00027687, partial [Drosera rotundifolia]